MLSKIFQNNVLEIFILSEDMNKKSFYHNYVFKKTLVFLEISIFMETWTKNDFSILSQKNVPFLEMLLFFFANMVENRLCQRDLETFIFFWG